MYCRNKIMIDSSIKCNCFFLSLRLCTIARNYVTIFPSVPSSEYIFFMFIVLVIVCIFSKLFMSLLEFDWRRYVPVKAFSSLCVVGAGDFGRLLITVLLPTLFFTVLLCCNNSGHCDLKVKSCRTFSCLH